MTVSIRKGNAVGVTEMENTFTSSDLTVTVGDTVVWTNHGQEHHTTTSDNGLWDSKDMKPGDSFSYKFKTPGSFPYSCTYHKTMGMRGRVFVLPLPPAITSPATAIAAAGLPFRYTIEATHSPTTFSADPLPPGLLLSGNTIVGTPAADTPATITIGAKNVGGGGTGTLALQFVPALETTDSDGDGFSDSLETFTGSDPNDAASTPFGISPSEVSPLAPAQFLIALNYKQPQADRLALRGTLPLSAVTLQAGDKIVFDICGVERQFTLGPNLASKAGRSSFRFGHNPVRGAVEAPFSLHLSNENLKPELLQAGFSDTTDVPAQLRALSVTILLNGVHYQSTQPVLYTAKANTSVTARSAR